MMHLRDRVDTINIGIKTINGSIPLYKTIGSSGFDIMSNENILIKKNRISFVHTGVFLEIPDGFEVQVRSRSGLSLNHGIFVLNSPGTVDSDYRGELCIILMNLGDSDFTVSKGDRIAQGVLSKVYHANFEIKNDLSNTERGEGGFGSTGI